MPRLLLLLLVAVPTFALDPVEVIVVTNKNVPESRAVADHYRKARGVPAGNVVELDLPKDEDISRKDYDARLLVPLRDALRDRKEKVKCLLCIYGVPLRVGRSTPSAEEQT